jgi:TRAP-type uncharacterized transport system substrate-binding protein
MAMIRPKVAPPAKMVSTLSETFGFSPALSSALAFFIIAVCLLAVIWFIRSAPPRNLTISGGPPGSTYERYAKSYKEKLADHGVTLKILPSAGSQENLHRLQSSSSGVDIGFVQGGIADGETLRDLVSLGSIAYQPLMVFYRGQTPIGRLSELAGRRIAVGALGSGTHTLALALLQANGISTAPTILVNLDADAAAAGLLKGNLDGIFLMGDSASIQTLRTLIRSPDVQLYSFTQADAYVRKFTYLNKMDLPEGSIDLAKDLPAHDTVLLGPTVELVARKNLNSAISDLLVEVAQEVHGKATILQKEGEFPIPLEHTLKISDNDELQISDDAARYYKSGKSFTYRHISSFWLASLLNRIAVAFLPLVIVVVPTVRFFPNAYKLRIRLRFYHFYRQLMRLERGAMNAPTPEQDQELLRRLDEIERAVNKLRVPASLADQFYALRGYIKFVRSQLKPA